jgi:formylglycine-generating enzyme required for sulfatase activity
MQMKKIFLFLLVTLAVFGGCSKDKVDVEVPKPPIDHKDTLGVDKTIIEAVAEPAAYRIAIACSGDWTATVIDADAKWCTIDPEFASGTGNRTVSVEVQGNLDPNKRYTTILVSLGKLSIEVAVSQYRDITIDMVTVWGNYSNISDFRIGKYEVTQKLWGEVMGDWPDRQPSLRYGLGDNYPMYYVSYDDVQEFLVALNHLTGKNYRLPTENEWKYAAQGGPISYGYPYSGSDNIDDVAWYLPDIGVSNPDDPAAGSTHIVGQKAPNELGLYDMTGNVWEWCGDEILNSQDRIYRGGSWFNFEDECLLTAARATHRPNIHLFNVGFRLMLPL